MKGNSPQKSVSAAFQEKAKKTDENTKNETILTSKIMQVLEKLQGFNDKNDVDKPSQIEKKSSETMKFLQIAENDPKLPPKGKFDEEKVKIINEILEKIDIFQSQ